MMWGTQFTITRKKDDNLLPSEKGAITLEESLSYYVVRSDDFCRRLPF